MPSWPRSDSARPPLPVLQCRVVTRSRPPARAASSASSNDLALPRFAMQRVPAIPPAVLHQLEPVAVVDPVLHRVVVPPLALVARERDFRSIAFLLRHRALPISARYFTIVVTRPAPTVRPPSRIAKRRPSSIAIGAISSTVISTLSPGITISTPSGRLAVPVTSVVRK